jgi:hypothetical protein
MNRPGSFPPNLDPIRITDDASYQRAQERKHTSLFSGKIPTKKPARGIIIGVNSQDHSYQVQESRATRPFTAGRLLQDTGDATLLPVGTHVALTHDYDLPLIIGVIPFTAGRGTLPPPTATPSDETAEPAVAGSAGVYRLPHMPTNLLPGDKTIIGPDGNMIGALSGGLNTMKSGFAEVRTHQVKDLVEVICRNFRQISGMGISEIKSEDGRTNWSFRGGAHQATEAGADQENWSIRIDLGAEGDLFRFELTQPDGTTLFHFGIDGEGHFAVYAADGIDQNSGRNWDESSLGNHSVTVGGNETKLINGQQQDTVNGTRKGTVSSSETRVVGNDLTETVVRHRTDSVGGNVLETVTGGNPAVGIPKQIIRKTKIVNGTWEIAIGNPLDGALNPLLLAGYNLNTFTGDITMAAKIRGNLLFSTLLGNATLQTTAGLATLKTLLGIANVDGTQVTLGPSAVALANPVVKGTIYSSVFSAYCATAMGACTTAMMACTAATAAAMPGIPVDGSVLLAFVSTLMGAFSTLSSALSTLQAALPTTLSAKAFTA